MLLSLTLAVALSAAADAPLKEAEPEPEPPIERSFVVPLLENFIINFGLLSVANLIPQEEYARISLDTIASNIDGRQPWRFDKDHFITNQFGHTYHGAMFFTAARSSGLNFWWSSLYPITSSLFWEVVFESEPPSFNDQATTSLGGIFLGETLHRLSLMLDELGTLGKIGSFVAAPFAWVNRWMFDRRLDARDVPKRPGFYAEVHAGGLGTYVSDVQRWFPQARISTELVYGLPYDPDVNPHIPFSHFVAGAGVSFPGPMTGATIHVRGLVFGGRIASETGAVRGFAGIYGQYDLEYVPYARVSSVGVGGGGVLQFRLGQQTHLELTGVLSGVPMGAAGELPLVTEENARDYAYGAGGQVLGQARLVRQSLGSVGVTARAWLLRGSYVDGVATSTEFVTSIRPSVSVRLTDWLLLTLEAPINTRNADFVDGRKAATTVVAGQASLGFSTDATFGFERAARN
ncbi:MAG: DUF3943 domain-containing protein [Archangium sp.]